MGGHREKEREEEEGRKSWFKMAVITSLPSDTILIKYL